MATTFYGTDIYNIYMEALKLSSFKHIKNSVCTYIDSMELPNEQKISIRLAAESMGENPHADEPLIKIMEYSWQDFGISNNVSIEPITVELRKQIIELVMAVCKQIILEESDRLATVASGNAHLSYGYGYGQAGYGYGFDGVDFFDVFGVSE